MKELNAFRGLETVADEGYDVLTVTDMGCSVALAQVDQDGQLHNVIISLKQLERLAEIAPQILALTASQIRMQ